MAKKKKSFSTWKRFVIAFCLVILFFAFLTGYNYYRKIYAPAVVYNAREPYLYIPTGSNYDNVLAILQREKLVRSIESFDWVARKMNLPANIHPGKYKIGKRMSNYNLAALLRSGIQEHVRLVINKFRLKSDFIRFVSTQLEVDSGTLIIALNDSIYLRQFNLNPENVMTLFVPNTYEFYWNTSAEKFLDRMKIEHDRFWNTTRKKEAAALNLTPAKATILASIVEEETNYNPEKPLIAGVYLNRIRRGMNLQADPTVKFAIGNFAMKRIYSRDLDYVSPYNTYLHQGLPPGPICTPSVSTIDSVLHAPRNEFLYFCADPDKPGTHVFARTLQQHQLNALRYQRWLNSIGNK